MKLIRKSLSKDKSGEITLCPQDSEDMWHAYNLIHEGDEIEAWTHRKVAKMTKDGPVRGSSERKLLKLKLKVESVDFEPADCDLRIKGKVIEDHEDVPAGTYHTFSLDLNRNFKLYKLEWDLVSLEVVENSTNPEAKAEIAAIVMEEGVAHLCLITDNMTFLRQKVEQNIPKKKRGDNSGYEKGMDKFYELLYNTMNRTFKLDKLKVVLLASPGFVARGFYDYMQQTAVTKGDQTLVKSKGKFLVTHSSTGYLQGLDEVLKNPEVQSQLSNTRYQREVNVLDSFFKCLNDDDMRAWYGPRHVEEAVAKGAVATLLITDSLFRSNDIATRKKYIAMVEELRNSGREALIFSTMHQSGKELSDLGGIACILLYPDPELEEVDDWDAEIQ